MINYEKARAFLRNPIFPFDSKIQIKCRHKAVVEGLEKESLITECLLKKIKKLAIGKTMPNKIESIVDFNCLESVKGYFKDRVEITDIQDLDVNSFIATVVFQLEIYYGNKDQIDEEIIEDLESIIFKTFFAKVVIN